MPSFPEISWTDVKFTLVRNRKSFTSVNAAQIIMKAVVQAKLQNKDLKERFSTLNLIDLSWHSKRKIWYGYTLIDYNKSADQPTIRTLQYSMKRYFDSVNVKLIVKTNIHDDILFISLTTKNIRNKKKRSDVYPLYIALFPGQENFFISKKNVPQDITDALVTCMGSKGSKMLKLKGRHLKSLNEMCWRRKGHILNCESINEILQYRDASPVRKSTGTDYMQCKQRKKYAEKCFGDKPPTLESLVMSASNIPWVHSDISKALPNEKISVTWEFRSHNITTFLTKLIEQQVLVTPVPKYISDFMVSGKNQLILQNN